MNQLLPMVFIVLFALSFAGCSRQQPASQTSEPSSSELPSTSKVGKTTKTGSVSKLNNKFFLQETGQPLIEIDSYAVDLAQYEGKTVSVTGEYSGNTLFVGEIK